MDKTFSNGQIYTGSEPPPGVQSVEQEAFTVHSVQGETVPTKIFIDRRRMWEAEHWYTALSRARTADQIYIVDIPLPEGDQKYDMYKITSKSAKVSYIGHTLSSVGYQERFKRHLQDAKN